MQAVLNSPHFLLTNLSTFVLAGVASVIASGCGPGECVPTYGLRLSDDVELCTLKGGAGQGIPTGTVFEATFDTPSTCSSELRASIESPTPDRLQELTAPSQTTTFRAVGSGTAFIVAYERQGHTVLDVLTVDIGDCTPDGGSTLMDAGSSDAR